MPEKLRQILEPNTSTINERIRAITNFVIAGYEVHLNFSPVIVYDEWLEDYKHLFELIDDDAYTRDKLYFNQAYRDVKAEVIFLTHNKEKHEYNLENAIMGEEILWRPDIQESKISQYGGRNIRYKAGSKSKYIEQFRALHDSIIPWNTIRYIF